MKANKKGMMISMCIGPIFMGIIVGIIIGIILMAYLINNGIMSASMIPV